MCTIKVNEWQNFDLQWLCIVLLAASKLIAGDYLMQSSSELFYDELILIALANYEL